MTRYPGLTPVPDNTPFDPYSLADGAYDINLFVTTAGQDSESFRLRISNTHLARISQIVASKEIPEYKTPADVVRDCIHHRMWWLANEHKFPGLRAELLDWQFLDKNTRRIEAAKMRRKTLDSFREGFDIAYRSRDLPGCYEMLEDAQQRMDLDDSGDTPYLKELGDLVGRMREDIGRLEG